MQQRVVNDKLFPLLSLVIYGKKDGYTDSFYIESRKLEKTEKGIVMHAPVPLSESVYEELTQSFRKHVGAEMKHESLIGSNLLYAESNPLSIVWVSPAKKVSLNFRKGFLTNTKGNTVAYIPACLYVLRRESLYVYALNSNERPTLSTKLYNAPFLNVYSDGKICMGTAPVGSKKADTFEQEAERYERGFFMAEQNGGHDDERKGKKPLGKLWSELIKSGAEFPVKELNLHKKVKTVADAIAIAKGGNHDD